MRLKAPINAACNSGILRPKIPLYGMMLGYATHGGAFVAFAQSSSWWPLERQKYESVEENPNMLPSRL